MAALMDGGDVRIDGFLCPGHVSVVIGSRAYEPVRRRHRVPCVVAGFEAADMAGALAMLLRQISEGRADVEVQYTRSVSPDGNVKARRACDEVFSHCDSEWRGLGVIPRSGLEIRREFAAHDAARTCAGDLEQAGSVPPDPLLRQCRCGDVLRGVISPALCPLFGRRCTPSSPVGPCMVSGEGSCAAHYRYGKTPILGPAGGL
jgi:hydrogenase expression/formation protein HypD